MKGQVMHWTGIGNDNHWDDRSRRSLTERPLVRLKSSTSS